MHGVLMRGVLSAECAQRGDRTAAAWDHRCRRARHAARLRREAGGGEGMGWGVGVMTRRPGAGVLEGWSSRLAGGAGGTKFKRVA